MSGECCRFKDTEPSSYGFAILLGLMRVTIIDVRIYRRFQPKSARYTRYIAKMTTGFLVLIATLIVLW